MDSPFMMTEESIQVNDLPEAVSDTKRVDLF